MVDEPLAGLDRLFELPPRLEQPGRDPPAEQMIGAGFERLLHPAVGRFPVAPVELELGQPGRDVGILGLLAPPASSSPLIALAYSPWLAWQSAIPSAIERSSSGLTPPGSLAAAPPGPRKGLLRLGIAAVLEQPPRLVKLFESRPCRLIDLARRLGSQRTHQDRDPVSHSHAWFLLGLLF